MTPEQQIERLIADQARRIADLEAALRDLVDASIALEKTPGFFVKPTDAITDAMGRLIRAENAANRLLDKA